jgi:hypothetical protein
MRLFLRPWMAGMPKMQEHFSANAMDGGDGGNAGAFSGVAVRIPARSSLALTHIVYRYTVSHGVRSFRSKDTQRLFGRLPVRRYVAIEAVARRKLQQLHAAASLEFPVIAWSF